MATDSCPCKLFLSLGLCMVFRIEMKSVGYLTNIPVRTLNSISPLSLYYTMVTFAKSPQDATWPNRMRYSAAFSHKSRCTEPSTASCPPLYQRAFLFSCLEASHWGILQELSTSVAFPQQCIPLHSTYKPLSGPPPVHAWQSGELGHRCHPSPPFSLFRTLIPYPSSPLPPPHCIHGMLDISELVFAFRGRERSNGRDKCSISDVSVRSESEAFLYLSSLAQTAATNRCPLPRSAFFPPSLSTCFRLRHQQRKSNFSFDFLCRKVSSSRSRIYGRGRR